MLCKKNQDNPFHCSYRFVENHGDGLGLEGNVQKPLNKKGRSILWAGWPHPASLGISMIGRKIQLDLQDDFNMPYNYTHR